MKIDVENFRKILGSSIFFSGVKGVGKTTLCNVIAQEIEIQHVTASSLLERNSLSVVGGESECICRRIEDMLISTPLLLVDGHFVLSDLQRNIVRVDAEIYRRIRVQGIIVLVDAAEKIQERLEKRDGKRVDRGFLAELQNAEIEHSARVARMLNVERLIVDLSQKEPACVAVSDAQSFIRVFLNGSQ